MKLAFDVDGCLAWFTAGYAALIRQTSGRDLLTPEMIANPPCWNWDLAAGYTKEEVNAAWHQITHVRDDFWLNLPNIPGLDAEFFLHLDDIVAEEDVYFLTHRAGKRAKHQTEEWLFNQGITNPTVLLTGDKLPILRSLNVDVFIDDKPETLNAVGATDVKLFKVNYTYNAGSPGEGVASVKEMLERLGL
jgi:hypothetical protein